MYELFDVFAIEQRRISAMNDAMHAKDRWFAGHQQQIARLPLGHQSQQHLEAGAPGHDVSIDLFELIRKAVKVVGWFHLSSEANCLAIRPLSNYLTGA